MSAFHKGGDKYPRRVTSMISDEAYDWMLAAAGKRDLTFSQFIRGLIEETMEREKK